jgi:hypothetical protein
MQLKENFRRVVMGPARSMLSGMGPSEAALLAGGWLCNLPCDLNGTPLLRIAHAGEISPQTARPPPYRIRRVLAAFQYELQLDDPIPACLVLVPVERPRRAALYRFGSGAELARALDVDSVRDQRARNPCWGGTRPVPAAGPGLRYLLTPRWQGGQSELTPQAVTAEFYMAGPATGASPVDCPAVATRRGRGPWRPVTGPVYVTAITPLTAASLVCENGSPARLVFERVEAPPLEDFLAFTSPSLATEHTVRVAEWRTAILVQIKNATLPSVLRETAEKDLVSLTTRIETLCLDLASAAGEAKDRGQRMLEANRGDPSTERALARALLARIEVLKPMLAAIKQERINRQR